MMPTWRKLGYIEEESDFRVFCNEGAVGGRNENWDEIMVKCKVK